MITNNNQINIKHVTFIRGTIKRFRYNIFLLEKLIKEKNEYRGVFDIKFPAYIHLSFYVKIKDFLEEKPLIREFSVFAKGIENPKELTNFIKQEYQELMSRYKPEMLKGLKLDYYYNKNKKII